MAIAALIAVGSVAVVFIVTAARHGANPQHVRPAGGVKSFQDATDFLGMIAVVLAAMIGVTAGAGDAEIGTLRDLLATGALPPCVATPRARSLRSSRRRFFDGGACHRHGLLDSASRTIARAFVCRTLCSAVGGARVRAMARAGVHRHRDLSCVRAGRSWQA